MIRSTGDTLRIQGNKEDEDGRMGKDTLCKQQPSVSWNGYTNTRQIDFEMKKNVARDRRTFYNDKKINPPGGCNN